MTSTCECLVICVTPAHSLMKIYSDVLALVRLTRPAPPWRLAIITSASLETKQIQSESTHHHPIPSTGHIVQPSRRNSHAELIYWPSVLSPSRVYMPVRCYSYNAGANCLCYEQVYRSRVLFIHCWCQLLVL